MWATEPDSDGGRSVVRDRDAQGSVGGAGVEFCAITRLLLPQPAATGEVRGPFPATCATCVQIRHRSVPEGVEKWRLREVQSLAQSHTAGERQGWGPSQAFPGCLQPSPRMCWVLWDSLNPARWSVFRVFRALR